MRGVGVGLFLSSRGLTDDIIQQAEIQQRVRKSDDPTRNDLVPITKPRPTGKRGPERGDGEKPDQNERG